MSFLLGLSFALVRGWKNKCGLTVNTDLWKRGILGTRVSQDLNKPCKKSKLSAWPSHVWPNFIQTQKKKRKCTQGVCVICRHQHKNFYKTFFLAKIKLKPKLRSFEAAQMSQWGIMHVIKSAWIGECGWGASADTQDIELQWHLHRSAFQKTARSLRHIRGRPQTHRVRKKKDKE